MTNFLHFPKLKRWFSRCSSLLLMFQKTPLMQMLFPQANLLASSAALNSSGFAIATVVGLGAYDSVAGATTVVQVTPNAGGATVPVTIGTPVNAVFQLVGTTESDPQSWSLVGTLPAGLTLSNEPGRIATVTGTVSSGPSRMVAIKAWQNNNFSGESAQGTFTFQVAAATGASIVTHPASTAINSGSTATLMVTAGGTAPLTYQWYEGDSGVTTSPVGTNSPSFTTPVLTTTTRYWVKVTNGANPTGANSNAAIVTVRQPAAVATHPQPVTIDSGQTAMLSVTASGDEPLTYQWYQGASGVTATPVGTNSASLTTPVLTATTSYWVKVSNVANPGGANSDAATVTVRQPAAITSHPASIAIQGGESTMLSVTATGDEPLTYQWYEGYSGVTTSPVGTNAATFTTPVLSTTARYWVRVSNAANPDGADSTTATVTVLHATPPWAHAMSTSPGLITPTSRGGPGSTWFGWALFNDAGLREQPIDDSSPDIGDAPAGARFQTTNGQDHVLDSGAFFFAAGSLAEQITVPTDGAVGSEGFTTLILQIAAPAGSGAFPGPVSVGAINAVAPVVVQGLNESGDGQFWAKWQLPGNQASYVIDLSGPADQANYSFEHVVVDTSFSLEGYLPDSVAAMPPAITTASPLPVAVVGQPYNLQLQAAGGTGPYAYAITTGTLPAGVSLSSTGLLSGTAGAVGSASFTVLIEDANVLTSTKALTLNVTTAPVITTAPPLARGLVGSPYQVNLAASGGTAPYSWTLSSGSLPAGVQLSSSGVLSGDPATAGLSSFTIAVEDANGLTDTETYSISISDLAIATQVLPVAVKGVAFSHNLSATGGVGPYQWTVSGGTLPPGITLNNAGLLSGTSGAPTVAPVTFAVTDADGVTVTRQLTVTVSGVFLAPVLNPISFPVVTIGTAFSHTLTAQNYPKTFTVTGLPSGLKLVAATGVISGRPAVSGIFNVQVRAANAGGKSALATVRLTVKALDRGLVGTFGGWIERHDAVNRGLGGMVTVTTTSNGSFTVKLTGAFANSGTKAAAAAYSATGFLAAAAPQLQVTAGGHALALTLNPGTGAMTGTLGAAVVRGWRNVWHAQVDPADGRQGYYSFALDLTDLPDRNNATIPQGTGFATFSVTAGGTLTIAGKGADGEAVITAAFISATGEFWLYAPQYKNQGTLLGQLTLAEDAQGLFAGNTILGGLTWSKPATATKSYPDAFGPVNVTAEGAYLAPASKGNVILGLPETGAVHLSFSDGGLAQSVTNPNVTITYTDDNKVVLPTAPGSNPGKTSVSINPATGAVSGNFSLEETTPPLKRSKVVFLGQVVRLSDGEVKAAGYFLLPQIPAPGKTPASAPSLSGGFSLLQPEN